MLTNLSKIETDFEVDFEVDVSLFILHFSKSHFYKFFVENKKNHIQHTQIEMVLFELITQNNRLFSFTFYLITKRVNYEVLLQGVLLFLKGKGLVEVED